MPIKYPQSYLGVRAPLPPNVITAERNPAATDVDFVIGDLWVNTATGTTYQLSQIIAGAATWTANGSGAAGGVVTLTGSSGGARSPTAGNINLLGTANQITTTGAGSTITWSLPAAITAPGSLTTTTTLASGTTVTAGTGITATTGNITATNGNLVLSTAGNKLSIATGANASVGTSVAMTAGSVTVATSAVTASSKIFLTANTPGGTQGTLSAPTASIVAGTQFVINSSNNADTSTVNWWIVN